MHIIEEDIYYFVEHNFDVICILVNDVYRSNISSNNIIDDNNKRCILYSEINLIIEYLSQ